LITVPLGVRGALLVSDTLTRNITFGDKHLSTSIYGDDYTVTRTDNLCRDIAELYLVNKSENTLPDGYTLSTTVHINTP
jgi:hypothetical protein